MVLVVVGGLVQMFVVEQVAMVLEVVPLVLVSVDELGAMFVVEQVVVVFVGLMMAKLLLE